MATSTDSQRWPAAVHEAGHAVVAQALGLEVVGADAVGDAYRSGSVQLSVRVAELPLMPMGTFSLAGLEAERLFGLARPPWVGVSDRAGLRARVRKSYPCGPAQEWTAVEDRCRREAARLVEAQLPAVRRVAEALQRDGRLSGEQISALVNAKQ